MRNSWLLAALWLATCTPTRPPVDEVQADELRKALDITDVAWRPTVAARGFVELEQHRLSPEHLAALAALTSDDPSREPTIRRMLATPEASAGWDQACEGTLAGALAAIEGLPADTRADVVNRTCTPKFDPVQGRMRLTGVDPLAVLLARVTGGILVRRGDLHMTENDAINSIGLLRLERPQ